MTNGRRSLVEVSFARHRRAAIRPHSRRGLLLIVVLVMVVLLALLAAGYTLMVRAHLDGITTQIRQFKIRMAADSGVQQAVVTLRYTRGDLDTWYSNPELYRAFLVQGPEGEETKAIVTEQAARDVEVHDPTADEAFRFSLFAPNFDDPTRVRYGFTDESSRMDLNSATEGQLRRLFEMVIPDSSDFPVDINVLVDSLLDWREPGDAPRANGAKSAFYQTLEPPYRAKGAPFSSVEELLMVRGFTPWVLFGEDYNQNGLLDPNEDDGDASFPLDDANGVLYRGIAPFLTVWSQETNTSGDNRPRIFLNMQDVDKLREKLEAEFDGDIISYVMAVRSAGVRFNSVMNLLPAPEPDEEEPTSQPDDENDPTTQPTGGDPSSQPSGENREMLGGASVDDLRSDIAGDIPIVGEVVGQQPPQQPGGNPAPPTRPVYANLTAETPPGTLEDLPLILDRLTTNPSPLSGGRINVSTAPREVLSMLEELTPEDVEAIVATRQTLDSVTKSTPAWLVTQGVISEYKFRRILDRITTNSSVYRIEPVGYADDVGIVERYMVIIQMRGPVPQVLYYRNLNPLGMAYRPHGEELRTPQDSSR